MQDYRPMGAFSFLGRYRIIDFPLSNMSNSGIENIQVYARENPRSLTEHLSNASSYNINSKRGKLQLLFADKNKANEIYNTDVEAFNQNLNIIERARQEYVVLAPSYMVYAQDFDALLSQHIASGADITLLYQHVNDAREKYLNLAYLNLNRQKGVESIATNRGTAKERNIFMDTYIMKKALFVDLIKKAMKVSSVFTLSRIINESLADLDVRGVAHRGYFAAASDFKSYFDANLDLLDFDQASALFDPNWPIYTVTTDSCPTQYFEGASIRRSMVANGSLIEGTVENSVLGRGVQIGKGAVIKNCVILAYAQIGDGVHLENQVVDKWAKVIHVDNLISDPEDPGYVKREDVL